MGENVTQEFKVIGSRPVRHDGVDKVTGRAKYGADYAFADMLHGKILRSPFPHALIRRIDVTKALKVTGVVAVLTRDDIMHDEGIEPYYGPVFKDQTLVAVDKVRHVGDPVAAVAALSGDAAEEALGLVDVEYDELPAVLNVQEALKPGATLVHESVRIPESGFADLASLNRWKAPIFARISSSTAATSRRALPSRIRSLKIPLRFRLRSIAFSRRTPASRR